MMNTNIFQKLIFGSLITLIAINLGSCKKKNTETDAPVPLFGSWTRSYTGTETYHARLNLKTSGVFEWIMLDTLYTHTNSFAKIQVSGDLLHIYDDPDFSGEGIYKWQVAGDVLSLTLVSDAYAARVTALSGSWNLTNPPIPQNITGSWQKTVVEQGISYRVKLVLSSDGILNWIMTDPIPGHTNSTVSFAATDSTIAIYNDPDCNGNGYFKYIVNGADMTCTYLKDQCPPRTQSFSGTWSKMQ